MQKTRPLAGVASMRCKSDRLRISRTLVAASQPCATTRPIRGQVDVCRFFVRWQSNEQVITADGVRVPFASVDAECDSSFLSVPVPANRRKCQSSKKSSSVPAPVAPDVMRTGKTPEPTNTRSITHHSPISTVLAAVLASSFPPPYI